MEDDDPYLKMTNDVMDALATCAMPFSNSVDFIPIRKYLSYFSLHLLILNSFPVQYFPSWFPGTGPANQARAFRPAVDKMHQYPFEDVKRQIVR